MRRVATPTHAGLPRVGRTLTTRHLLRTALLLVAVFVAAFVSLRSVGGASLVPAIWPTAGVAAGLHLTSPARLRRPVLSAVFVLVLAAHLVHGFDLTLGLGFSLTCVASVWVLRRLLVRGLDGRRVALLDQGDVSRMIGSISVASLVAGAGCGLTDLATGHGNPLLGALAGFGGCAASLMILLPLFLETLEFEPLAGARERAVQSVITVGTTLLVFLPSHAAADRLRGDADVRLARVPRQPARGHPPADPGRHHRHHPDHAPASARSTRSALRYGLPPEVVADGVLQLFLLDCGLILLPLSVMVTQQRMAAARADAERETLQRLVSSATGTAIIATGSRRPHRAVQPRGRGDARLHRRGGHRRAARRLPPRGRAGPAGLVPARAAELRRHLPGLGAQRRHPAGVALRAQGRPAALDADDADRAHRRARRAARLPVHRRGRHRARGRARGTALHAGAPAHRGRAAARPRAGQGRLRLHRQPRAAYADHEHHRLHRGARGRHGRRADRRPARGRGSRRAQRQAAAAARRGPADALADRVLLDAHRAGHQRPPHRRRERARRPRADPERSLPHRLAGPARRAGGARRRPHRPAADAACT